MDTILPLLNKMLLFLSINILNLNMSSTNLQAHTAMCVTSMLTFPLIQALNDGHYSYLLSFT